MVKSTAVESRAPAHRAYVKLVTLASGGMGTVHAVVREEGAFRRLYAMKTLRETFREDEGIREMFLGEARIAGLIRHPNVVSVLDLGETEDDGPYLIMEYVEGVTVDTLIRRARERRDHIPVSLVLRIARDVAAGLQAAHETRTLDGGEVQVVHRDVSPHNVLLGFDGVVRVTDFGVAKVLGHLSQTDTGVLKGKMGYMSPEQLRFEPIDRRSDLFSLGIVLYEMLTLTRLYRSRDGTPAARAILHEPPPDVGELRSDLPAELVALLFTLLAKQPDKRPPTAREVEKRLAGICAELGDGDAPSLADYLNELFAEERAARTQAIAAALAGEPAPTLAEEPDDPSKPVTHVERRAARRGVRWLPLLAVAAAVVLTVAWLLARDGGDVEVADAPPAAAAPIVEPRPTAGAESAAPDGVEPPAPAAAEPAGPETAERDPEAADGARSREDRDRAQRRARDRRAKRRSAMTENGMALPANDIWTEFP